MKKLFITLVVIGLLGSELFAGFYVVGTINQVSTRADGTFWVNMKRQSDGTLTHFYQLAGSGNALQAMQATVLSAKIASVPVQLFWDEGEWHRAELLP